MFQGILPAFELLNVNNFAFQQNDFRMFKKKNRVQIQKHGTLIKMSTLGRFNGLKQQLSEGEIHKLTSYMIDLEFVGFYWLTKG